MTSISIKRFDELTSTDLYHILRARSQVFVVEQRCSYQDIDGADFDCLHLVAFSNETLMGYCRIIPPDHHQTGQSASDDYRQMPAIGRVLVLPEYRGQGLARQVMIEAMAYCKKHYRKKPIVIAAQTYLLDFYASLGFVPQGGPYFEDGLEHITMVAAPPKKPVTDAINVKNTVMVALFVLSVLFIVGLIYLML